ncbi:MAG: TlpA disulfide reductase family protein [Armatimonadota bacterium]|nr:TlpA disulfide reductase family protein [Armatimonadota bacterium]
MRLAMPIVLLLTFAGLLAGANGVRSAEEKKPYAVGDKVDDFSLPDINGKSVKLSDAKGKVVLLQIFAHWCPPCNAEAPRLEAAWTKYQKQGAVFAAIAIAARGDAVEKAREFAKKHSLTFPVLVDARNVTAKAFGVRGVPTNVIIGKDGKVAFLKSGFNEKELFAALDAALAVK